ncbi:MAG: CDP-diacylglycerol--glycerol-3-phosphate 3-phosphatidyltransferase [Treponema sp.]|nr:CDP-diacylglycerol--glycerol-3-phosphate 3-phosphatidyltransferase [Treponema sp.]
MKTSNKFTLARVLFAPFFFILYFVPVWLGNPLVAKISAIVMIPLLAVAQLTDYWDGHYARKSNEVSDFGKLFDPFADVMLNLTLFICAQASVTGEGYMPIALFILILYREFSMNFLRMVAVSKGTAIAARKGGKFKTVFYISSGFIMLALESLHRLGLSEQISSYEPLIRTILVVMFVICVLLSYLSFSDYIITFSKLFSSKES